MPNYTPYSLTFERYLGIISGMNLETAVKPLGAVKLDSVVSQAVDIDARLPQIDPHCEAIAVIPVYREFYGPGRIVGLLEELQAQNIGSRRLEIILVVNNPPTWDAIRCIRT